MINKNRTMSLWEDTDLPTFSSLNNHHETDVCIVGGGVTGLMVAYQLAKKGRKVSLVEAFEIGRGQTSRMTAHLSTLPEAGFSTLMKYHSMENIKKFYDAHEKAINIYEDIIKQEGIQCDFSRLDGYLFQGENDSWHYLIDEQDSARFMGITLERVDEAPLLKYKRSALKFKNQGQLHPFKFIQGLLRALEKLDVQIFENTRVNEIKNGMDAAVIITTEAGHVVAAQHAVVATHTPFNNRYSIHTKQFAYRTYAIEFEIEEEQKASLLWDTADPYHYIRMHGKSLIVGGEDHRTGMGPDGNPFMHLERWAREHFSFAGKIKHEWSGQILESSDGMAFIGKNPGAEKNIYICTGESGTGLTYAAIASLLIPDLVEGKSNPWKDIFDPGRKLHGVGELVRENITTVIQYKDWITPAEVNSVNEIPLDTGGLLRDGLGKNCVYHETPNEFEAHSAVCPHLGGIVHWNDIEKTWDCPCHGSRFNTHGNVIEGPAASDLSG